MAIQADWARFAGDLWRSGNCVCRQVSYRPQQRLRQIPCSASRILRAGYCWIAGLPVRGAGPRRISPPYVDRHVSGFGPQRVGCSRTGANWPLGGGMTDKPAQLGLPQRSGLSPEKKRKLSKGCEERVSYCTASGPEWRSPAISPVSCARICYPVPQYAGTIVLFQSGRMAQGKACLSE